MKIVALISILYLAGVIGSHEVTSNKVSGVPTSSDERGEKLFNGKNFNGWYILTDEKGREKNLFAVDNYMIHAYPTQTQNTTQSFGGLITKNEYSNYELTLEYKWGTKKFKPRNNFVRDAGIVLNMHGADVIWPNGVECQIQEGDTGDLWLIGTQAASRVDETIRNYSPQGNLEVRGANGKRFNRFHRSYSWETPGWNKVKIEVKADTARFWVNGHLVNEAIGTKSWDTATSEWKELTKGKILLQAEGAEVFYRNIYIKKL